MKLAQHAQGALAVGLVALVLFIPILSDRLMIFMIGALLWAAGAIVIFGTCRVIYMWGASL